MKRLILVFLGICSLIITTTVRADDPKWTVSVIHNGSDPVGTSLAFALREVIRGSNGYQLVTGPAATFRISLITLNPEEQKQQLNWTVASATIMMRNFNDYKSNDPQTWYPIYLQNTLYTVGSNKVNNIARDILAMLDTAVEDLKQDMVSHGQP